MWLQSEWIKSKTKRLNRDEKKTKNKRKIWLFMVTVAFDYESRIVYDYDSLIFFISPSVHIYPISFTAQLTSLQRHIQHYFRYDTVTHEKSG